MQYVQLVQISLVLNRENVLFMQIIQTFLVDFQGLEHLMLLVRISLDHTQVTEQPMLLTRTF